MVFPCENSSNNANRSLVLLLIFKLLHILLDEWKGSLKNLRYAVALGTSFNKLTSESLFSEMFAGDEYSQLLVLAPHLKGRIKTYF